MVKEIELTQGKVALVDDEDYEWLNQWKWHYHKNHLTGYAERKTPRPYKGAHQGTILMHRMILGVIPEILVDHINGSGIDNRRANLRTCSHQGNSQHRRPVPKEHTSFKGVYPRKGRKGWIARIKINATEIYLGSFQSDREAAKAYNEAALKYHGEFAWLNVV